MADTRASAFPRALTDLLALALAAPAMAPDERFHLHHRLPPVPHHYYAPTGSAFGYQRQQHQQQHHHHQDFEERQQVFDEDDADLFQDLDSPRSRASSSDGESAMSTTSSTSSSSSRYKCSLAFILGRSDAASPSAVSSAERRAASLTRQHLEQQRRAFAAPPPIQIPDIGSLPSSPSSSGAMAAAAAALNSHTPTNECAKVKRRRAPTGKVTKSCKAKTSAADVSSAAPNATPMAAASAGSAAAPVKKGSKYCIVEGCGSRAKHARRCWKHGGSVKCKVADCANRAKTKGVCWSHGGGTICSFANCGTISVSNGVCWAHGGGKRCAIEGCARPAYERTDNLCSLHFDDKNKIVSGAAAAPKPKAARRADRA